MGLHSGKVALISGGARGQGREIARRLAAEGADIAIFDLCAQPATSQYPGATEEDLAETVRIVEAAGRRCFHRIVDVRDHAAVSTFVDDAVAELGRLDIVCANAGLVTWIPFLDLTPADWAEVNDINVTGAFNTVQPALRHLVEQRSGTVVLTSSVNGLEPGESIGHYTASKHAVLGLMKNLALEFGPHGVRVNAVMPSAVNTVMGNNSTNLKWIFGRDDATEEDYLAATRQWHVLRNQPALTPDVVAGVVSWLVSDDARHLTGISVPVDAGHLVLPGFNHNPITE
ncbi:mycofactocin-coupled SDR family oxidoreductase [Nocardioides sp. LMS-CY]|uniref:mycofactocin-coupled SDR family oxidoreductase n=1 Tax=Nocardioides sp. (strain LMS-CY) TaxID=2840457 RepID=UPI001C002A4C|nr:mycofactocin-coupled SDR family oxidoreductase [Nocardioides sp. LMS-CY]QWF22964.1 mycofactocin-coupled SDR family oxidoreductase [Nocardioides sp. LMS-CY]